MEGVLKPWEMTHVKMVQVRLIGLAREINEFRSVRYFSSHSTLQMLHSRGYTAIHRDDKSKGPGEGEEAYQGELGEIASEASESKTHDDTRCEWTCVFILLVFYIDLRQDSNFPFRHHIRFSYLLNMRMSKLTADAVKQLEDYNDKLEVLIYTTTRSVGSGEVCRRMISSLHTANTAIVTREDCRRNVARRSRCIRRLLTQRRFGKTECVIFNKILFLHYTKGNKRTQAILKKWRKGFWKKLIP